MRAHARAPPRWRLSNGERKGKDGEGEEEVREGKEKGSGKGNEGRSSKRRRDRRGTGQQLYPSSKVYDFWACRLWQVDLNVGAFY